MGDREEGTDGAQADPNSLIAQYQTTRIRQLWTNYKRIFQLTTDAVLTVDPSNFSVTNTFPYSSISKLGPDEKTDDQFIMEVEKTVYNYKTAYRGQLLCQLFECITKKLPTKFKTVGPLVACRLRKNGSRVDCRLIASPFGIVETDVTGRVLQEYRFVNISKIGFDERLRALFFRASGRSKVFFLDDLDAMVNGCKYQLKQLGINDVGFVGNTNINDVLTHRQASYAATGAPVSTFDVNKITRRSLRPMPRQLNVTEEFIVEKDASGFQYVSYHKISSIYALVRNPCGQREFTIEYEDGTSVSYTCAVRDSLLSILLDIAHAVGNHRVIVTGQVSDSLRLMPRFAEEDYQASIRDAFFGASSIEAWFLARLAKVCRAPTLDVPQIEIACMELNANVPCPGVSANSDQTYVKAALTGVLRAINTLLLAMTQADRVDNTKSISLMLQTLYRLIPCIHGYKGFCDVKEVDTRILLLQLIKVDSDFINYWALELLMVLCRCPLNPRNNQQEFVNKHTLLTDHLLKLFIEMMSSRIDIPEEVVIETDTEETPKDQIEGEAEAAATPIVATESTSIDARTQAPKYVKPPTSVARNASATDHIASLGPIPTGEKVSNTAPMARRKQEVVDSDGKEVYFPNSLVIVAAAALLESIVSSQRDTSSPELIHKVLDLLCERNEVLVFMLRSNSFLIMENAAILMFVLLKNRPHVADSLREMALSECLVLKHFYSGIFSPSVNQRFISRFLIATWMSGPEVKNPGKQMLLRMIPTGLTEYLKHTPITEEHRKNLDEMEDEFYSTFGGSSRSEGTKSGASELQMRMRRRIAAALKEHSVDRVQYTATNSATSHHDSSSGSDNNQIAAPREEIKKIPENYRIMFHVMTQDHKLPDLIWNEQTRLELRSVLDYEIKEFDREQRLRGLGKVAWNYQQFFVKYDSLKDEMQVGSIYVRYFLEAGDAFLRSLENPSHIVLFEKLFRRMLSNVESNPNVAILCTQCICRLYSVCRDIIGGFDDMLLIVKMLEKAANMELQHCMIDLLEVLCLNSSNVLQLLDKEFVNIIIKYVTLAHINPDQIGNVLARATANVLLLRDTSESEAQATKKPHTSESQTNSSAGPSLVAAEGQSEEDLQLRLEADLGDVEKAAQIKRSLWVPDDISCPKSWFVAPKGPIPPPLQKQRGPFRVSELLAFVDLGQLDDQCLVAPATSDDLDDSKFEAVVDTGRWRMFKDYFQLRLQMLFPGKVMYGPAEIAAKGLNMLTEICDVHRACNSKGVPFFPIPTSKRIMSDPEHLAIFATLLLSNNHVVVESACKLIRGLVEMNTLANSKLYLTGVFFFACRYTGNNFLSLAKLFDVTHLRQSFHDAATSVAMDQPVWMKSVLGPMLPPAMISLLVNYGAERFSAVFTGDFDTPEVIWNAELRNHLVELIDMHIGMFAARLRQYTMAKFEFVPIAKIHFPDLDKEIYVHEYYLRNLNDEVRFPDWPIVDPLLLLREVIQRWRDEMSKGIVDNSVSQAKKILELPERYDNKDLRKAYKNLARQYHPDKNSNGRDMFEKIQLAYELLSKVELKATETNMINVLQLLKTQNLIYRRYSTDVESQKYPVYLLLVEVSTVPAVEPPVEGIDGEILLAATMLMYYTSNISPLNAKEFVKVGAVVKLHEIIQYALKAFHIPQTRDLASKLLIFAMKTMTSVAQFDAGRDALLALCPTFADDMNKMISMDKHIPVAVENALEVISRGCSLQGLQQAFVDAGLVWKLVPMLLGYDGTLQEDYHDESQRMIFNQTAANVHAVVSAKALGRLGGFMFDALESPANPEVRAGLGNMLTQPIMKLLRNRRPWELLGSLNENCEKATKIWNVGMRKELLDFVTKIDNARPTGSRPDDLRPAQDFKFTALRDELCIGGVYVRIFNKNGDTNDIDDPSQFCRDLIDFVWAFLTASSTAVSAIHQDQTIDGLRALARAHEYIAVDIAKAANGLETVFRLLERPSDSFSFGYSAELMSIICGNPEFVVLACNFDTPPVVWRLLRACCVAGGSHMQHIWSAAEAVAAHPDGLRTFVDIGAIPHLLCLIFGVASYANSYSNRLSAIALLSKCLSNPVKGQEASAMLRRFLPEPVVVLLRARAGSSSLKVLDDVVENPELIWTAEMQGELRAALTKLVIAGNAKINFENPPPIDNLYAVVFRQLAAELYVGGVYIRLYLKQPTFHLSNPVYFAEKLIEFWEGSFNVQVPKQSDRFVSNLNDSSRELVLGKEDFLTLITSCMICLVKGEPQVLEHLLAWGFIHTLCDLLKRAVDTGRLGAPATCIIRLLHQFAGKTDTVENLASANVDVIALLTKMLGDTAGGTRKPVLHKESTFIVEVLKKIFTCISCRSLGFFVQAAMNAKLPHFLLEHVVGAAKEDLAEVRNANALRIHAVDVIKAIMAADEGNAVALQALLDLHHAWNEYRDQSHDLFITNQEKTDVFLIMDASDSRFNTLLITDGSASAGVAQFFTSTTTAQSTHVQGMYTGAAFVPPPSSSAGTSPRTTSTSAKTPATPAPPVTPTTTVPPTAPVPAAAAASASVKRPSVPSGNFSSGKSAPAPNAGLSSASSAPPASSSAAPPATPPGAKILTTSIMKGEFGIGLDLAKTPEGGVVITRLKEMPPGVPNPAAAISPAIKPNDRIVGVNGQPCMVFNDVVKLIRSAEGLVQLTLERS